MPSLRYDYIPMKRIFVTGISTDVGKTIVSAILVEALQADYWKPVQAGDLDNSDSQRVASLVSNSRTTIHPAAYELKTPMSPHAAAYIDGVTIAASFIERPVTSNHLVIEGAGGLFVPLNETETIADLIHPEDHIVLVSRNYLGSINHSLLTLEALAPKGNPVSVVFNGIPNPSTENIITLKTGVTVLGHINWEKAIDRESIRAYAKRFKEAIERL